MRKINILKCIISSLLGVTFLLANLNADEPEVKFSMDINRMDKIVSFFINDIPYSSWIEELDRYDENDDGDITQEFNIYDVDAAIDEFLNPPNLRSV